MFSVRVAAPPFPGIVFYILPVSYWLLLLLYTSPGLSQLYALEPETDGDFILLVTIREPLCK